MNDFVFNRGQGLKARLGGTPLSKRPLSTSWNRVSSGVVALTIDR